MVEYYSCVDNVWMCIVEGCEIRFKRVPDKNRVGVEKRFQVGLNIGSRSGDRFEQFGCNSRKTTRRFVIRKCLEKV